MKSLFPEIKPYQTFFLETDSQHSVYVEECGNPEGLPVIFLHGGPCSGCKPDHRRFFDPEVYRIILFDQRGCGLSIPYGELDRNTTQDLIDDMERIRSRLQIKQWLLFGGSWGGALALLYAQHHRERVSGLIIRGVFLARRRDLDWFVRDGANRIYPEQWARLLASVPQSDSDDLIEKLCDVLSGNDEIARRRAAREWSVWGSQVALGSGYLPDTEEDHVTSKMVQQARMEMHYAKNKYFIEENRILEHCNKIKGLPTIIIHGRNDLVCPVEAGLSLHLALPESDYVLLPASGHVALGTEMIDTLVSATEKMKMRIQRNK